MKIYFIILVGLVSSCKAQKILTAAQPTESLQYYSDICNRYVDYTREYLNDSIYIERHNDVTDTLMVKGSSLFRLHKGAIYKLIDAEEDFSSSKKEYRYYYFGLSPNDTLQKAGESNVQHSLRLMQSIIIFVPVKTVNIGGKDMFMYYTLGDCYPASEKCIKAKITNGQYAVIYFEKGIGCSGFAAGDSKCKFFLTDKSYQILLQRNSKQTK
jgi:hypothetical protein